MGGRQTLERVGGKLGGVGHRQGLGLVSVMIQGFLLSQASDRMVNVVWVVGRI